MPQLLQRLLAPLGASEHPTQRAYVQLISLGRSLPRPGNSSQLPLRCATQAGAQGVVLMRLPLRCNPRGDRAAALLM